MMASPNARAGPPPLPPLRSRSPLPPSSSPTRSQVNTHYEQPSRPLPPLRAPVPLSVNTNPLPAPPPSTHYSPFTPSQSSQPSEPASATVETDLDRSDTLTSVRSLDRTSFSSPSRRPLPKPPGGVNPSKSLDRGVSPSSAVGEGAVRRGAGRKQPSVVNEENEETLIDLPKNGNPSAGSHPPQAVSRPYLPQQPPAIAVPDNTFRENVVPHIPAELPQLPAINIGDSDSFSPVFTDDEGNSMIPETTPNPKKISAPPVSPGIQFTGAPVIAVSSFDTADDMMQGGEISFSVPMVNIEGDSFSAPTKPLPLVASDSNLSSNPPHQQAHIHPNAAILCAGCQNPIIGRIVNAMNQRWHPHCFMCAECGELLEHVSSYEFEGKAYCHLDYHDKFAHHCHHCKTPIVESRFITLDDEILGQRYYHELHFFCSECGDPFLDPSKSSAPGTEKSKQGGADQEEDGETNEFRCRNDFANNLFFPQNGAAICTICYEQVMS
ncbi:LIM domain-containing protein [Cryptococcus deuterogattii MMRL2647]|nr:LIM domain-containing protein [Cryptococcus deuterogattii MMRL2647]